jgi:FkbM family methyltransferase
VCQLIRRFGNRVKVASLLAGAGATSSSILLFPIRRRLRHPRCEINLRNGISIVSPPNEPLVSLVHEVWARRCYAPATVEAIPGATIIDVGAHAGVFALWAASTFPALRVIAVEPSAEMYRFLCLNIERNKLGNVSSLQAAVGGQRREAVLYHRGAAALNSLYTQDNYGSQFRPLERTQVVLLDDLFERFQVQSCPLLKLDCEGAEYEILFNTREETLQRIRQVAMEYHVGLNPHTPEEMMDFLASQGFKVVRLPLEDEEGGYLYATRQN